MDIQIYKKKYCIVIGVILLVLMGIGSIWDYQISQFFYNSSNIFGVFLAGYGQIQMCIRDRIGGDSIMDYNDILSDRVKTIKPSGIRKFFDLASQMDCLLYTSKRNKLC